MPSWKVIAAMVVVALIVAWASNRGMIPYVNQGKKLTA